MGTESNQLVITIDGPAGSGKTTTAKQVAHSLGYLHLDSGAMYRAITLAVLREGINPEDPDRTASVAARCTIEFQFKDDSLHVLLDGKDISEAIRRPDVTEAIAPVAANPRVREVLVAKQREIASKGGIVAEGRDMGTVVFPKADLKIYLIASIEERARRRYDELGRTGIHVSLDELKENIRRRDETDSTRQHGPLQRPSDAIVLDTTGLSIAEQVDFVVSQAYKRGAVAVK